MQTAAQVVVNRLLRRQVGHQRRLRAVQILVQPVLEGANVGDLQVVQIALRAGKENHRLLLPAQRLELRLLQQFGQPLPAIQLLLRQRIKIGTELRKGRQLAVLRQVQL